MKLLIASILVAISYAQTGCTYLSSGANENCAVRLSGEITCWGDVFSTPNTNDIIGVSIGWNSNCAMRSSGGIICWGSNSGLVSNTPRTTDFIAVSSGGYQICAVLLSGRVICWGNDDYGQISNSPRRTADFIAVSSGQYHSCALRLSGGVVCWGNNDYGQVSNTPSRTDFIAVSSGRGHNCALRLSGGIMCWGKDEDGQVFHTPTSTEFIAVSSEWDHNCALRSNGGVTCWGRDNRGQVSNTPNTTDFVAVSSGWYHNCALRSNATITCWGRNDHGQVSNTPRTNDFPLCNISGIGMQYENLGAGFCTANLSGWKHGTSLIHYVQNENAIRGDENQCAGECTDHSECLGYSYRCDFGSIYFYDTCCLWLAEGTSFSSGAPFGYSFYSYEGFGDSIEAAYLDPDLRGKSSCMRKPITQHPSQKPSYFPSTSSPSSSTSKSPTTSLPTHISSASPPTSRSGSYDEQSGFTTGMTMAVIGACIFLCVILVFFIVVFRSRSSNSTQRDFHDKHIELIDDLSGFVINFEKLQCSFSHEDLIGRGASSSVYKATYGPNRVAVKMFSSGDKVDLAEFNLMKGVRHPNVVFCYGICLKEGYESIVLEFIDGKSLFGLIQEIRFENRDVPFSARYRILMKAAFGLAKLHDLNIVHRDLAARNIMVSEDLETVKIIDFGMSREDACREGGKTESSTIPIRWSSPELFIKSDSGTIFSFDSDIWAFGCTIYELLMLNVPFWDLTHNWEVAQALQNQSRIPHIPSNWDDDIQDILKQCWSFDKAIRPSASDIYEFFKRKCEPVLRPIASLQNPDIYINAADFSDVSRSESCPRINPVINKKDSSLRMIAMSHILSASTPVENYSDPPGGQSSENYSSPRIYSTPSFFSSEETVRLNEEMKSILYSISTMDNLEMEDSETLSPNYNNVNDMVSDSPKYSI